MSTSPGFSSVLGPTIAAYLSLKRALGRRFRFEAGVLAHLDKWLAGRSPEDGALTSATFMRWSLTLTHLTPTVRRNQMRIVRNFCMYLRRIDPSCFVPDPHGFPAPHTPLRPHIFTTEQIGQLLHVAAALQPRSDTPLCPQVFRLAIVLLYTAGLRRGELVRLVLGDYDPLDHTILIRASKFHKSRLVALSPDAILELDLYLQARRRLPHAASSPLLVHRVGGLRAYSGPGFGRRLHDLFRRAGIRMADGRIPRVHDLRHTYAVHTLLRWYRTGGDVQAKLPILATAMGHVSIASTAYYLRFIEPITQAASERFAQYWEAAIPAILPEGGRS